jgi:hypothetical protein
LLYYPHQTKQLRKGDSVSIWTYEKKGQIRRWWNTHGEAIMWSIILTFALALALMTAQAAVNTIGVLK